MSHYVRISELRGTKILRIFERNKIKNSFFSLFFFVYQEVALLRVCLDSNHLNLIDLTISMAGQGLALPNLTYNSGESSQ